jgi:hypothetical protein
MAGIARESRRCTRPSAQRAAQLDGVSTPLRGRHRPRCRASGSPPSPSSTRAAALTADLRATLDRFAQTFEQRSASLVDERLVPPGEHGERRVGRLARRARAAAALQRGPVA